MRLEGKVAFITGAGAGIGGACARAYLNEGAKMALVDINAEALTNAVGSKVSYQESMVVGQLSR